MVLSDEIYTDLTFPREYNSISKFYLNSFITGGSKWYELELEIRIFIVPKIN